MSESKASSKFILDIDHYLNPYIPRPPWRLLPAFVSHWFGYRASGDDWPKPSGVRRLQLLVWLFSFLGAFCGIAIIENVFRALPLLGGHQVPLVIASYGAAAIIEYNTLESPLAQPRNLIGGQVIAAAIGVGITKLFMHLPPQRFEQLRWLPGALAVGLTSTVMGMTKTVYPPAGATALLAASTPEVTVMGWWLLALVALASGLMLASAMIVNNLYKRFPLYWWTPVDLAELRAKRRAARTKDVEKGATKGSDSSIGSGSTAGWKENQLRADSSTLSEKLDYANTQKDDRQVTIEMEKINVPDWMELNELELATLKGIQQRLQEGSTADN